MNEETKVSADEFTLRYACFVPSVNWLAIMPDLSARNDLSACLPLLFCPFFLCPFRDA